VHNDAYICEHSENNIKCVVHDDLGWKNQTTRYILPHHWLYEWFSQLHVVELIRFFHGALQLATHIATASTAQNNAVSLSYWCSTAWGLRTTYLIQWIMLGYILGINLCCILLHSKPFRNRYCCSKNLPEK